MNKETRTWVTGLIAIIISNYFIWLTGTINEDECREIIIPVKFIFYLTFIFIGGWGVSKVLKTIE